jgi:large subunit ribosomal protein L21
MKIEKFAVIETGGKQYLVKPGSIVRVERIEKPKKRDTIHFDKILLLMDGKEIKIGNPYIKGAKISGKLLKEGKAKKITHLRYRHKTRHAVKKGHRQIFSEIKIEDF